ncbi:MAG: anion permease, partial [Bacilli bacterium]
MITFLNRVNLNLKQFLGLLGALLIFVVSLCLPSFDFISVGGIRTIGLLVSFLVILITSALPVVVTSILFIGLVSMSLGTSPEAPALGLKSLQSSLHYSLSGFSEPVVYFTLGSFGLTAARTTTPLSKRILKGLL